MKIFTMDNAHYIGIAMISAAAVLTFVSINKTSAATVQPTEVGSDDHEFVFMGKCANGQTYRLFSYEKTLEGQLYTFYDYEGPAGKGTVRSHATPRTMSVRVCRQLAEIIDDH